MLRCDVASWNIRDRYVTETLEWLLEFHGPRARGIVWAHNTDVGDARCTDMAAVGMVIVGQLVGQDRGENDVVLVGFATHRGTVIAGASWDALAAQMRVSPTMAGGEEDLLHRVARTDDLMVFDEARDFDGLLDTCGQRAIGVVYNPAWERRGNHVPTVLPRRYDGLLYVDETRALHPLQVLPGRAQQPPETYPWALLGVRGVHRERRGEVAEERSRVVPPVVRG